jgi:hypothetical protein
MHKPPHQRGHCDGSPYCNRKLRPKDEVGGWEYQDTCEMLRGYSETHNWDIPIRILQIRLSDNFHQMAYCGRQGEILLFYL